MVLASTRSDMPINEFAQLAHKITEVAIPEVANVSVQPNSTELESFVLKSSPSSNRLPLSRKLLGVPVHHIVAVPPAQLCPLNHLTKFAGITELLVTLLRSVKLHALIRETTRPSADGDQCYWPTT